MVQMRFLYKFQYFYNIFYHHDLFKIMMLISDYIACFSMGRNLTYIPETPLHGVTTFVPLLSIQQNDRGVQWSLIRILFLCNSSSNHCASLENHSILKTGWGGTAGRTREAAGRRNHHCGGRRFAVVADWRHSHRSLRGVLVVQRRHSSEVQGRQNHGSD